MLRIVIGTIAVSACAFSAHADTDVYQYITKRPLSYANLQAATRFCTQKFGVELNGTDDTPEFKQCMLGRRWRYSHTNLAPWPDPDSNSGGMCQRGSFLGTPTIECDSDD